MHHLLGFMNQTSGNRRTLFLKKVIGGVSLASAGIIKNYTISNVILFISIGRSD